MKKTALLSANSDVIATRQAERHIKDWLVECEFSNVSKTTLAKYKIIADNLLWFLKKEELEQCGKREIQ